VVQFLSVEVAGVADGIPRSRALSRYFLRVGGLFFMMTRILQAIFLNIAQHIKRLCIDFTQEYGMLHANIFTNGKTKGECSYKEIYNFDKLRYSHSITHLELR